MALLGGRGVGPGLAPVVLGTGETTGEVDYEIALAVDRQLCAVLQAGFEVGVEDLTESIDVPDRCRHTSPWDRTGGILSARLAPPYPSKTHKYDR